MLKLRLALTLLLAFLACTPQNKAWIYTTTFGGGGALVGGSVYLAAKEDNDDKATLYLIPAVFGIWLSLAGWLYANDSYHPSAADLAYHKTPKVP